jgi:hypothetical protein
MAAARATGWRNHTMTRQLLVIAALGAALGLGVSLANAAPASGVLESVKVSAAKSSVVEQARHYRRHHRHHHMCWWGDRWMCHYFW